MDCLSRIGGSKHIQKILSLCEDTCVVRETVIEAIERASYTGAADFLLLNWCSSEGELQMLAEKAVNNIGISRFPAKHACLFYAFLGHRELALATDPRIYEHLRDLVSTGDRGLKSSAACVLAHFKRREDAEFILIQLAHEDEGLRRIGEDCVKEILE